MCLDVNQGGRNHKRCTQTCNNAHREMIAHQKLGQSGLFYRSTLLVKKWDINRHFQASWAWHPHATRKST